MSVRFFSRKQKAALLKVAGYRCEKCGIPLASFHADHKRPYSKGGATDVRNGQALCPSCNRKKGTTDDTAKMAKGGN